MRPQQAAMSATIAASTGRPGCTREPLHERLARRARLRALDEIEIRQVRSARSRSTRT
jgi:hypothetical protein